MISVVDANINNEKCRIFNAGARALFAVKFDGISGTYWQKTTG
jgi:hypothetical protein